MKPILRVMIVTAVTAFAAGVGVIGVHASTQCVQFIKRQVRRHKVSAATAARWAAWNKEHPNWHPKPTPKETWEKLAFACEVPMEQQPVAEGLPTLDLAPLALPALDVAPPAPLPTAIAAVEPAPQVFPDQQPPSLVTPPIYVPEYPGIYGSMPEKSKPGCPSTPPPSGVMPPGCGSSTPPPPSATPEPSAWMLMGTGILAMMGLVWRRNRMVLRRENA